ncbi:MAG: S41 family peptidase [Armatimonadetes bacterium]|nr:S41 family peptidase [Armatimonadota bacterium]
MRKLRIEKIILAVFLLFVAFLIGFATPDVIASRGDLGRWIASLQLLPQRLEDLASQGFDESAASSKPLPIIESYSATLERLKADYYGAKIDEKKLTYNAIRGMLHALDDPFTRFLDPEEYKKMREENEGNFTGIGAQLDTNDNGEVYVKEPLPGTPAMRAGIKANDVIIAVDGKPIKDKDIQEVVKMIRGPEGTKVKLTLRRPKVSRYITKVITREVVAFQMVKWRMLDEKNGIGYVRLYQFNEKCDEQFDKALTDLERKHVKGLVLDLRANPGGLLQAAVDIGSRFIESGPIVIIQERGGERRPLYVEEEKHNHKRYPLVVLVDQHSASAAEIVSGAIKDDGVGTLVGVKTFGKGRVQTIMPLEDGSAVAITTAKYLTPNGTDIHKKGIEPDIKVEATEDFDPNDPKTDVQLAKAVDVLKVKMGLLPKSVLEEMKKTAQSPKADADEVSETKGPLNRASTDEVKPGDKPSGKGKRSE